METLAHHVRSSNLLRALFSSFLPLLSIHEPLIHTDGFSPFSSACCVFHSLLEESPLFTILSLFPAHHIWPTSSLSSNSFLSLGWALLIAINFCTFLLAVALIELQLCAIWHAEVRMFYFSFYVPVSLLSTLPSDKCLEAMVLGIILNYGWSECP